MSFLAAKIFTSISLSTCENPIIKCLNTFTLQSTTATLQLVSRPTAAAQIQRNDDQGRGRIENGKILSNPRSGFVESPGFEGVELARCAEKGEKFIALDNCPTREMSFCHATLNRFVLSHGVCCPAICRPRSNDVRPSSIGNESTISRW